MQVSTTTTFLNIEYQSGMQYLSNVKAFGTRKPPFFFRNESYNSENDCTSALEVCPNYCRFDVIVSSH